MEPANEKAIDGGNRAMAQNSVSNSKYNPEGRIRAYSNRQLPRRRGELELYEAMKAAWLDKHRSATSAEYTAAMRRIARTCGVWP